MQRILMPVLAIAAVSLLFGVGGAVAQDATPVASPVAGAVVMTPSDCTVEARAEAPSSVSGTPAPRVFADREADLPQGAPTDAEIAATIVAIERELAACINEEAPLRVAALMTDEAAAAFLTQFNIPASGATPDPSENDARIALVAVRDARLLDDGRVGAVVIWVIERPNGSPSTPPQPDLEANFHIYEQVDGRWLLDEEISGFIRETETRRADGGWLLDEDVLGTRYIYVPAATPAP